MGKERSSGGAAALWVEKQIWEETDADEERASTSSYTAVHKRGST
jgi:hypothetical protein